MKIIYKGIVFLIIMMPVTVFACMPARVSMEQRVVDAKEIYVGVVTRVVAEQSKSAAGVVASISTGPKPYSLEVLVSEVLKGKKKQTNIQPQVLNCGSGSAAKNDKVIVFYNGEYWYTTVFEEKKYSQLLSVVK